MGNILHFLVPGYAKIIFVVLAICVVVGDIVLLNHQLKNKEEMLATANVKIENLTQEYRVMADTLKKSIDMQNAAILQYQRDTEIAKQVLATTVKTAAIEKAANDKRVFAILNQPKPKSCQGSIDSLVNEVGSLQWKQ